MDAKDHPRRSHQTLIFKPVFAFCILRHRLGDRRRRALHFEKEQYRIGFIGVFDPINESMLDLRTVTPKSKNECHAAWERSGKKRNERRAAWERFSCFHGPVGCLQELPLRSHQTFIFKSFFCYFCSSGSTCWPLPARTQVEHMQYYIGFINVFDALIDSMLDHRTVTKK